MDHRPSILAVTVVLGAVVGVSLVGCGTGPTHAVKLRATSDLYCPNNKIDVSGGDGCAYEAVGCGRRASYEVEPREDGASGCCPAPGCRAYRTGPIKDE